jgi:catechol 2,3-dioxygenase-like lactoylglutathione lyase family enzyme
MSTNGETQNARGAGRRDAIQGASATLAAGMAAGGAPSAQQAGDRDAAPLGARLQGFQHFGLTVQNMDRAFAFYTEVLGGTEVMRDGNFQGGPIQHTLMADQEIIAHEHGVDPRTIGVPDLASGAQRLDVRFVQFDNLVIELLHYRDSSQPMGDGASWAEPREHMSPAYPRSLHLCFQLREDVDFDIFITDLEAECARRGMTQVRANRTIAAATEAERQAAPASTHANRIKEGDPMAGR